MKKSILFIFLAMAFHQATWAFDGYCAVSRFNSKSETTESVVSGVALGDFKSEDGRYTLTISEGANGVVSGLMRMDGKPTLRLATQAASVGQLVVNAQADLILQDDGSGLRLYCARKVE